MSFLVSSAPLTGKRSPSLNTQPTYMLQVHDMEYFDSFKSAQYRPRAIKRLQRRYDACRPFCISGYIRSSWAQNWVTRAPMMWCASLSSFIYGATISYCVTPLYHHLDIWLKSAWLGFISILYFSAFLFLIEIPTGMFTIRCCGSKNLQKPTACVVLLSPASNQGWACVQKFAQFSRMIVTSTIKSSHTQIKIGSASAACLFLCLRAHSFLWMNQNGTQNEECLSSLLFINGIFSRNPDKIKKHRWIVYALALWSNCSKSSSQIITMSPWLRLVLQLRKCFRQHFVSVLLFCLLYRVQKQRRHAHQTKELDNQLHNFALLCRSNTLTKKSCLFFCLFLGSKITQLLVF